MHAVQLNITLERFKMCKSIVTVPNTCFKLGLFGGCFWEELCLLSLRCIRRYDSTPSLLTRVWFYTWLWHWTAVTLLLSLSTILHCSAVQCALRMHIPVLFAWQLLLMFFVSCVYFALWSVLCLPANNLLVFCSFAERGLCSCCYTTMLHLVCLQTDPLSCKSTLNRFFFNFADRHLPSIQLQLHRLIFMGFFLWQPFTKSTAVSWNQYVFFPQQEGMTTNCQVLRTLPSFS